MLAGPAGERRFDFGKSAWNDTLVWNYGGGAELAPDKSTWKNISAVGECRYHTLCISATKLWLP